MRRSATGTRVPVLFVHGARTSRTMWRRQVEALEALGVPVLAPDLPGHGERLGERFTLEEGLRVLHDGVDALGGRALVVGLSLGGYLAVEHRARYPEQSAGLVAASCCTPPQTRLRDGWLKASRWLESRPDQGARINDLLVGLSFDDEGAQDVVAGGYALTVMGDVLEELAACDTLGSLRHGESPLWIVNGRWDHFRGGERRVLAAARESSAPTRFHVVPRARHSVSLDAPVAFNRIMLEAVAEVSARERLAEVPRREASSSLVTLPGDGMLPALARATSVG